MSSVSDFPDYSSIYPASIVRKKKGREILRDNQTTCSETSFDAVARPDATPRKKASFARDRIEFGREEIDRHIEEKVRLFVLRLSELYGTGYVCSIGKTHAQGPSAGGMKVRHENKTLKDTLHAVHSSCLPVINVQNGEEYDDFLNGNAPEPEKYILNRGSSLDHHQNSTRNLLSLINRVDIMLEGGVKDEKVRAKVIKIYNRVSQKQHAIEQAAQMFLKKYEKITREKIDELKAKPTPRNAQYQKICEIFLESIVAHKEFVDLTYVERLLDIPQPPAGLSTPVKKRLPQEDERREICGLKCGVMQKKAGLESHLNTAVSPLKRQLLGKRKRSHHNESKAFKQMAMKKVGSEKARKVLLHQFNLSEDQIKATGDCEKAYKFAKQRKLDFTHLTKVAEETHDTLEQLHNAYRLDLVKVFMKYRKMSFRNLLKRYNEIEDIKFKKMKDIFEGKIPLSERNVEIIACILERNISYFEINTTTTA